ncbi:Zinc finger MYM-type protein 1-like [Oopsacas minuta]|uniref:Zinc finger MYM-type protein 1-like n=1 Tax=Oopsacas minuta TaxID=111878 RepID=A0AAV7K7I1_9METZ|nr:Zinc finger MYM-type protein 1-like [Oopsacas minuta]
MSPTLSFHDIRKYIQTLSEAERSLISEGVTLLKLVLVLPSTNAVSERSCIAMRPLKTYPRTTMKQKRLNHLLLLHVHKDHTDNFSCVEVANSFVSNSEHRLSVFGHFH